MTARKGDMRPPRGDRPPAYVDRETGAAELRISPGTWDLWVAEGRLPPPAPGFPESTPRWRWEDVDNKLSGKPIAGVNPFVAVFENKQGHGAARGDQGFEGAKNLRDRPARQRARRVKRPGGA